MNAGIEEDNCKETCRKNIDIKNYSILSGFDEDTKTSEISQDRYA